MHAADVSLGILGANGIVGGGRGCHRRGAARKGTGQVAVAFLAMVQPTRLLSEVMNMAAIWKLPVIYVCEVNGFGEYTRTEEVTAPAPFTARGEAFGIPSTAVDGNDVLAVYQVASEAVRRARAGEGPSFIQSNTYRLRGHHVGDVGELRKYHAKTARSKSAGRANPSVAFATTWSSRTGGTLPHSTPSTSALRTGSRRGEVCAGVCSSGCE